jgi:hypothetical protein
VEEVSEPSWYGLGQIGKIATASLKQVGGDNLSPLFEAVSTTKRHPYYSQANDQVTDNDRKHDHIHHLLRASV